MIGLAATAAYLPEHWMTAAEIAAASSIPEQVILEKFGLRGKHIAAADEHVSDMSVEAASRVLTVQASASGLPWIAVRAEAARWAVLGVGWLALPAPVLLPVWRS